MSVVCNILIGSASECDLRGSHVNVLKEITMRAAIIELGWPLLPIAA